MYWRRLCGMWRGSQWFKETCWQLSGLMFSRMTIPLHLPSHMFCFSAPTTWRRPESLAVVYRAVQVYHYFPLPRATYILRVHWHVSARCLYRWYTPLTCSLRRPRQLSGVFLFTGVLSTPSAPFLFKASLHNPVDRGIQNYDHLPFLVV